MRINGRFDHPGPKTMVSVNLFIMKAMEGMDLSFGDSKQDG